MINVDADDNKFTDAYISASADFLVTHDSHLNVLKEKRFPKVNIITVDDFLLILKRLENS